MFIVTGAVQRVDNFGQEPGTRPGAVEISDCEERNSLQTERVSLLNTFSNSDNSLSLAGVTPKVAYIGTSSQLAPLALFKI